MLFYYMTSSNLQLISICLTLVSLFMTCFHPFTTISMHLPPFSMHLPPFSMHLPTVYHSSTLLESTSDQTKIWNIYKFQSLTNSFSQVIYKNENFQGKCMPFVIKNGKYVTSPKWSIAIAICYIYIEMVWKNFENQPLTHMPY